MNKILLVKVIFILLLCSYSQSSAQKVSGTQASARQVMQRVVASYQSFSSYQDKGIARIRAIRSAGEVITRIEFETIFKRPDKLRFSWVTEASNLPIKKRNMIWSDGKNSWVSFAFTGNQVMREESLAMAVAGATGISRGTAHVIPRLLTNTITGMRLDQLRDLKVTGSETFDGSECYVVTGNDSSVREYKLWIGRKDFFIRRIVETRTNGTIHDEVRTNITVNQNIADSRFVGH